jgi:transcriptional regulatory protein RtcR
VDLDALLGNERAAALDLFDRLQLEAVVRVCRDSRSLSAAGRQLFQASRAQRSVVNDADRLRKYLAKHGLEWSRIAAG